MAEKRPIVEATDESIDEPHEKKSRVYVRKCAILLGFCGKNYYGMQYLKQEHLNTIERELYKAMIAIKLIEPEHVEDNHRLKFQRCSRTDKGVSAAAQVVSMKLPLDPTVNLVELLNEKLPPDIKIYQIFRATGSFDSKWAATSRTYTYVVPTYCFTPLENGLDLKCRADEDLLSSINKFLSQYKGTHKFFNYTSKREPHDVSCARFIMDIVCKKLTVSEDIEFLEICIHGASFMLHQIRKMVGLAIACVRGNCPWETLEKSWSPERMNIPKAPALGLYLEQPHFNDYNNRFGKSLHKPIDFIECHDIKEAFKKDVILPHILSTAIKDREFIDWLEYMNQEPIGQFEKDCPPKNNGESERSVECFETSAMSPQITTKSAEKQTDAAQTNGTVDALSNS